MSYYFNKEDADQCKLICGDVGGNVRVLRVFGVSTRPLWRRFWTDFADKLQHFDLQKRVINKLHS